MSATEKQIGGDHYNRLKPQPIQVILAWRLNFCLGNTLKYIARAGRKKGNSAIQDLEKAIHYLELEIEDRERAAQGAAAPETTLGEVDIVYEGEYR